MHASGARKMNAVQLLQLKKLCGLAAFPGRLSFSKFPGAVLMVSDPEEVLCPLKIRPFLPQMGCPKDVWVSRRVVWLLPNRVICGHSELL